MILSKRHALGVSLGVILLHWTYMVVWRHSAPVLPAHFSQLVLKIVISKVVVLAAVLVLLRLEGEWLGALGLRRLGWRRQLAAGLIIGLVMFPVLNVGLDMVMNSLIRKPPATGPSIFAFFKQPLNLIIWLPLAIFAGGIVEEFQRIFVLTRFEKWLGRPGLIFAVVASSAVFGLGHLYQGPGSAISAGVSGVVFSLVYLRRRSALEPVVVHAFSDVLAIGAATLLAQ